MTRGASGRSAASSRPQGIGWLIAATCGRPVFACVSHLQIAQLRWIVLGIMCLTLADNSLVASGRVARARLAGRMSAARHHVQTGPENRGQELPGNKDRCQSLVDGREGNHRIPRKTGPTACHSSTASNCVKFIVRVHIP